MTYSDPATLPGFTIPALVDKIIAYEGDGMTEDEEIAFFQELINTGLCWQLQGHYGRAATRLIEAGVCRPPDQPPAGDRP